MMTTNQTARISYLGTVTTDGTAHGGWQDRRQSIPVAPVEVQLPDTLPVAVSVGWGDRERDADLAVWTSPDADGVSMSMDRGSAGRIHVWRHHGADRYSHDTLPAWSPAFLAAVTAVREAAARAEVDRPEVRTVCESYRRILGQIDAQHEAHRRQWERDVATIARMFRRERVEVGEQTVPGLCVVRSVSGTTLGYAEVWDGRFLGRIRRA